jgi:hypothetical protein
MKVVLSISFLFKRHFIRVHDTATTFLHGDNKVSKEYYTDNTISTKYCAFQQSGLQEKALSVNMYLDVYIHSISIL